MRTGLRFMNQDIADSPFSCPFSPGGGVRGEGGWKGEGEWGKSLRKDIASTMGEPYNKNIYLFCCCIKLYSRPSSKIIY